MSTQKHQMVYKDTNAMRWIGPLFIVASPVFFLLNKKLPAFTLAGWAFVIFGALALFLSSNLTVTADKTTRVLQLHYQFLIFKTKKLIPFDEIADIQAQESSSSSNEHSQTVHRLVAVLKDGTVVPFRSYFTHDSGKKQMAYRLRLYITGKRHTEVEQVESPTTSISM